MPIHPIINKIWISFYLLFFKNCPCRTVPRRHTQEDDEIWWRKATTLQENLLIIETSRVASIISKFTLLLVMAFALYTLGCVRFTCGSWIVDRGSWIVDRGPWILGYHERFCCGLFCCVKIFQRDVKSTENQFLLRFFFLGRWFFFHGKQKPEDKKSTSKFYGSS